MRHLALGCLLLLAGCSLDLGYAVAITVEAAPSLDDASLAGVTVLDFTVDGTRRTRARHQPSASLATARTERIIYRPLADASGELQLRVVAEVDGAPRFIGESTVTLVPGKTVSTTLVLAPLDPNTDLSSNDDLLSPGDGMPVVDQAGIPAILPLSVTACPGDVVRFRTDRPVDAILVEGGTVTAIDAKTVDVTAPADPAVYHVRMTPKDGGESAEATLTVACLQLLAGEPTVPGSTNAVGTAARFKNPRALLVTASGDLIVADTDNQLLRKIDHTTGVVTTLIGSVGVNGYAEGTGTAAILDDPEGLAYDGADTIYFNAGCRIRKVSLATAKTSLVAGAGNCVVTDGDATTARFNLPRHLLWADGVLYAAEWNSYTVRKIVLSPAIAVTTLAGTPGAIGNVDADGAAARFRGPWGLAADGGKLWVADRDSETIRTIDPANARVKTVAGAQVNATPADGTGLAARFGDPAGVATNGAGKLLVTEPFWTVVRGVDTNTLAVTTLVGRVHSSSEPDETKLGPLPGRLFQPWSAVRMDAHRIAITSQHGIVVALVP